MKIVSGKDFTKHLGQKKNDTLFIHFCVCQVHKNRLALYRPMNYLCDMEFEWDTEKSNRCYAERGFDFAYAAQGFFDPDRIVIKDNRYDYGEPRYQMVSKIQGRVFVVIFTPRYNAIRIISARKANQREVKQYEKISHDG